MSQRNEGRGGFWNRAGRRSGGDRPIQPTIGTRGYEGIVAKCDRCGNDLLPLLITQGCASCRETADEINRINAEFGEAEVLRRMRAMLADESAQTTTTPAVSSPAEPEG